ncbi:MAG: hypothetical protein H7222_00905 [Methylotenera sp.]|nr:hypothetical protein [Oligoflexia bacterium]
MTQRELSLPQARAAIDQDLFNLIPSWIKNLVQYEDIDLKGTANERPVKDLVDFVFVGPSISKNEFCLIFAYACLRNASIFFFEKDYFPLSHHSVKRFSFSSGDFLVIPRNDFNRWLDELHEVKG